MNQDQKRVLVQKIVKHYGEDLTGLTFALWGLAFKPNTDDMRAAPSRVIIKELVQRGARVQAFDPVAMEEAKKAVQSDLASESRAINRVRFMPTQETALEGTDALVVVTEWKSFRSIDFKVIKESLRCPVIFDGRNLYPPGELQAAGIDYYPIGRSTILTQATSASEELTSVTSKSHASIHTGTTG